MKNIIPYYKKIIDLGDKDDWSAIITYQAYGHPIGPFVDACGTVEQLWRLQKYITILVDSIVRVILYFQHTLHYCLKYIQKFQEGIIEYSCNIVGNPILIGN